MGLLKVGKPFSWEDAGKHRKYVRDHGVIQFLNTYNRVKDITNDELLWGDEVLGILYCIVLYEELWATVASHVTFRFIHRTTVHCLLVVYHAH